MSDQPVLHVRTPLLESRPISRQVGKTVYLKMEAWQPCASFKIRGLGRLCVEARARGLTRFVSSSGGNAGYAVAFAGRRLGVPVTVVVPETTSPAMRRVLEDEGAEVVVHGDVWDEADRCARELAADEHTLYAPPFDHPTLFAGHATLVEEWPEALEKPDAVLLSVGGGGLFCGVVEGLRAKGWTDTPVYAAETEGAASFAAALKAGAPIDIGRITSKAKTLGARMVCARSVELAKLQPVHSVLVTDDEAFAACRRLAETHRVLVELSCGAALAPLLEGRLPDELRSVMVVVCGGAAPPEGLLAD